MNQNRRKFLQTGAVSLAMLPALSLSQSVNAASTKASELVDFGRTKIKVSRLGFGVGDGRGKVFLNMGQETFTKLIHHAYSQGIRYFDMDPCHIQGMLAEALKGLDRNSYTLITGTSRPKAEDIPGLIPHFLKELKTDYIDGVLITAIGSANWAEEFKQLRDTLSTAKEKGLIKACGVSVHGLDGLKTLANDPWVDFSMPAINHKGTWMDGPEEKSEIERRDIAMPFIRKIHDAGVGVTAMKTFGATGFENAEERQKSINFIMKSGCVDTMPIRFENTHQLDEVIAMMEKV